jgi:arylsulfatase A-like enzyme
MMSDEEVKRSFAVDNSHPKRWAYTFGLTGYGKDDLDLIGAIYDSTLAELDALFERMVNDLDARGLLDDTIVVLTADHGEQLGEHHMLDHQFSLYGPLLRVPLIVHYPRAVPPGRDPAPVSNFDIFPTLLELCGIDPPPDLKSQAVSLLAPRTSRRRLSEFPAVFEPAFDAVRDRHPEWDPTPWFRRLRALDDGSLKLVCATDGKHELFDLETDPDEITNLFDSRRGDADRLIRELVALSKTLVRPVGGSNEKPEFSEQDRSMLESLGYLSESASPTEGRKYQEVTSCGF